jgi:hypothetical protein
MLQFFEDRPDIPGTVRLRVDDLLAEWPATVPQRIERGFVNAMNTLTRGGAELVGGKPLDLPLDERDVTLFASSSTESEYFLKAMTEYEWIETPTYPPKLCRIGVTPKGWAKYDELTRTRSNRNNPAFVAMWFGGNKSEDQERQTKLFGNTIRPACTKLGWKAERVDSEEHNDSIIDRIISMIRVAPFVIADLSENNRGVYYEAGFARGVDVPVIYLVREGTKPHFDVSSVNHVIWSSPADLAVKLENRILGTMGKGPHTVS